MKKIENYIRDVESNAEFMMRKDSRSFSLRCFATSDCFWTCLPSFLVILFIVATIIGIVLALELSPTLNNRTTAMRSVDEPNSSSTTTVATPHTMQAYCLFYLKKAFFCAEKMQFCFFSSRRKLDLEYDGHYCCWNRFIRIWIK